MNELEALVVMVMLFSLQCVVPLIIILALGHLMNFIMLLGAPNCVDTIPTNESI